MDETIKLEFDNTGVIGEWNGGVGQGWEEEEALNSGCFQGDVAVMLVSRSTRKVPADGEVRGDPVANLHQEQMVAHRRGKQP